MIIVSLIIVFVVIAFIVLMLWNYFAPNPPREKYELQNRLDFGAEPQNNTALKKGHKTAVVIGGTCEIGVRVVKTLVANGYQVIVGSRGVSRFLDCGVRGDDKVAWIYMDTRISSSLRDAFGKILCACGRIDVVVNLACLKGDYQMHTLSGERNGDDIHIKLTGAYKLDYEGNVHVHRRESTGVESWIFTNVIGLINVAEECNFVKARKIVLLSVPNKIIQGTLEEIQTRFKVQWTSERSFKVHRNPRYFDVDGDDQVILASPENVHEIVSGL